MDNKSTNSNPDHLFSTDWEITVSYQLSLILHFSDTITPIIISTVKALHELENGRSSWKISLYSENFGIFFPDEFHFNLDSWVKSALKIIKNDTGIANEL